MSAALYQKLRSSFTLVECSGNKPDARFLLIHPKFLFWWSSEACCTCYWQNWIGHSWAALASKAAAQTSCTGPEGHTGEHTSALTWSRVPHLLYFCRAQVRSWILLQPKTRHWVWGWGSPSHRDALAHSGDGNTLSGAIHHSRVPLLGTTHPALLAGLDTETQEHNPTKECTTPFQHLWVGRPVPYTPISTPLVFSARGKVGKMTGTLRDSTRLNPAAAHEDSTTNPWSSHC